MFAGDNKNRASQQNILENGSFNNSMGQQQQNSRPSRPLKPYESTEEYKTAFITRAKLVRTPP